MERILITGATGFTGKRLFKLLLKNNYHHSDCTVFLTDIKESLSYQNYIKCDLTDSDNVRLLIEEVKPTHIYNLAGTFTNDFFTDFNSNAIAVKNILDNLIKINLNTKVLLIGSAAEYGNVKEIENPIKETHSLYPINLYGLTKVFQRNIMNYYVNKFDLNIVMARTFNIYGKGISDKLFAGKVYSMIDMHKKNEIKTLSFNDLENLRDYIHINDALNYYLEIMNFGIKGEVYNVGNGKPMTNRDLLKTILKEEGLKYNSIKIQNTKSKKVEVKSIYADITKLNKLKL